MTIPRAHRAFLEKVPAFAELSRDDLDRLWNEASLQDIASGTTLMEAGARGMEAYLVLDGRVKVALPDGRVAGRGAGELIGELALLGESTNRRSATVTADGPVKALVINRADFEQLLQDHPGLLERVRKARQAHLLENDPAV